MLGNFWFLFKWGFSKHNTRIDVDTRHMFDVLDSKFNWWSCLWKGWWNSAVSLEMLTRYTQTSGDSYYIPMIKAVCMAHKKGLINNYYDDEGWWALAFLKAHELFGEDWYLNCAKHVFDDMVGGWDDTFSGGIWWSKDKNYKNAIANELFMLIAAKLYNITKQQVYHDWALRSYDWFIKSGMINGDNLVNDGLDVNGKNNGCATWTYNQGVILGALIELALIDASKQNEYLSLARSIADSVLVHLTQDGILKECCESDDAGNLDGCAFKGIFMRYLGDLSIVIQSDAYNSFLFKNANTVLEKAKSNNYCIGNGWTPGPVVNPNSVTLTSALDCVVADYNRRIFRFSGYSGKN